MSTAQPGLTTTAAGAAGKAPTAVVDIGRRERWAWSGAVGVVTCALLWTLSARQWARLQVPSWDLGIYTQMVKAWAGDGPFTASILGPGFFAIGDHFNPALVLLAPFYLLAPSGFTLLAAQAVLFGLTAALVTHAAVGRLGRWGAAIGLACGLSYLLAQAQSSQFHDVALALPLLAMSLIMLLDRRIRAACLWALPMLLVKEDMGLTIAAIGFVALLRARSTRQRVWGVSTMVAGLVGFLLVTQWLLPALNTDGIWRHASSSSLSLLASDPAATWAALSAGIGQKLWMVALPILVSGIVSVRSPLMLVALPTFGWRLISGEPYHWTPYFHYGAVLAPIVFLALVDALVILRRRVLTWWTDIVVPAAVLAVALMLLPRFALWDLTRIETWQQPAAIADAQAALAQIEDGEHVVTDITLMAALVPRAEVYWLGNDNPVPDAVLLNRASGVFSTPPNDVAAYAASRFPDVAWETVWESGEYAIARPVADVR